MDLNEFKTLTGKILSNLQDQALVSELLTTITDDYTQQITSQENLHNQVSKYEDHIKSLQNTNMNLFLKVSNAQTNDDTTKEALDPPSFDDLLSQWNEGVN